MAQSIEENLVQIIKKDDVKAFNNLMEKAQCGEYRLGRFPVLSLLYLYNSRRILAEREREFLKITGYKILQEPVGVSKKFSEKAGKCLRLYITEVVTPSEMLLILDKTKRLKSIYPLTNVSDAVKNRLKAIYSIRYSLNVKFEGNDIIIDRRPLSYREKKNIATACLCSVLAISVAVGVPVTTVALIPKPVEGEVTKLSQIDFNSTKEYTLKNDIVLPENFKVEKANCKITGEGNKLIFEKGAVISELGGRISDLVIESSGDAVFSTVKENAVIENVTINVNAANASVEGASSVAETNLGTIDGVTLNVSGNVNANSAAQADSELTFGGLVYNNSFRYNTATQTIYRGVIKNCTVNYSDFKLNGVTVANAAFGGVAGINNGYLQDCTVNGKIIADTFDVAGVCATNNGALFNCVNNAELRQTSSYKDWNPIVCGIVLNNTYVVENCQNRGKVEAVSECGRFEVEEGAEPVASASGIAYLNRAVDTVPYIKNCANYGDVECRADYRKAYATGVCLSSSGNIESCQNFGAVTVKADYGFDAYAGGIAAVAYGDIYTSVNNGAVSATCDGAAYAGGIAALSCSLFSYCLSSGDITVAAKNVYAGGIFGFCEVISYGYYVYFGMADYCISQSRFSVTLTGESPAYAGGIAGYVREEGFNSGESLTYFGGCVTNCCFYGECASEVAYFGNITGVCGASVYENNLYASGSGERRNFDGNCYVDNSYKAFGAALAAEDTYYIAEDKGATAVTSVEMENSELYKSILTELEKTGKP